MSEDKKKDFPIDGKNMSDKERLEYARAKLLGSKKFEKHRIDFWTAEVRFFEEKITKEGQEPPVLS